MNRLFALTALLAFAILASTTTVQADDKDEVKTSAIMKKSFGGKKALFAVVGEQGKKMNWDDAAKTAKEFFECVEKLPKGAPKKGDKDDFAKAAKSFVGKVKDLKSAVDEKDSKKFKTAASGIQGSCKSCHTAHR